MQARFTQGIRYVPTLPTVLGHLLAMLDDEASSSADIERIIQHDQALSSKVLSVANSAYYGFRHEIDTVRRAAVALGYDEIRNICMGAGLMGFLHHSSFRNQDLARQLWLHSLGVAEGARVVAVATESEDVDRAFTAGLLHDLGKVVLAAFFPDDVETLYSLIEREQMPYQQAEVVLGMEHWQIGTALAGHWKLPALFAEVMGHHHTPTPDLPYFGLTASVHIADGMAREMGIGITDDSDPPYYDPVAIALLPDGEESLAQLREELNARREGVEHLWHSMVNG